MNYFNPVAVALNQLAFGLVNVVPLIIMAVIIWFVGDFLINLGVKLLQKIDIKGTKWDNKVIDLLSTVVKWVGKFLLLLIVLDYLGIGRTIIGAILNGFTLAVAIALGISFGEALKGDAMEAVTTFKRRFKK